MTEYSIRKTELKDLDEVMEIYAYARRFMSEHGNPRQWGPTCWPPAELIRKDIALGKSYLCVGKDGARKNGQELSGPEEKKICAVFYYDHGPQPEPGYAAIVEGNWDSLLPYGVVHRIAAAEGTKGTGAFCLNWAFEKSGHLKIDTHPDNKVMQNLLKKLGFEYRGIIYVEEDDDPRYAYEKTGESEYGLSH